MKFRLWCAVCAFATVLSPVSVHAVGVSDQGTWETTLHGRDLDGDLSTFEAYWDETLNITWFADAKYALTSGYDSDGYLSWPTANTWAAALNPYGSGITGWRLPVITDTGSPGCAAIVYNGTDCGYNVDTATSEFAHLFFITLGNLSYYDTSGNSPQPGWGLTNTGPFSNLEPTWYWSATEYSVPSDNYYGAWYFFFDEGFQYTDMQEFAFGAWAVHAGDVGQAPTLVPAPAAVWLFGTGLIGLVGMARRKKT